MKPKISSRNVRRGLTFFLCVSDMMIYYDTRAQGDFSLHLRPGDLPLVISCCVPVYHGQMSRTNQDFLPHENDKAIIQQFVTWQ